MLALTGPHLLLARRSASAKAGRDDTSCRFRQSSSPTGSNPLGDAT